MAPREFDILSEPVILEIAFFSKGDIAMRVIRAGIIGGCVVFLLTLVTGNYLVGALVGGGIGGYLVSRKK